MSGWLKTGRFLALGALAAACQPQGPSPSSLDLAGRNLVVITIDTLRADRLGAYGDSQAATPVIDALAREGVRFANCYSSVTLTMPGHATLFTGRYPFAHGVRVNGIHYLPEAELTLAEQFRSRGYDTFAAVASYVVARKFGLAQGFETYDDSLGSGELFGGFEAEIPADRVIDKFSRWLAGRSAGPFFAWIHFYDPHLPYEPPAGESARAGGDPYRGEIAFVDSQIGRLRDELERYDLAAETALVLTSDHGEAFGEHVEEGHGLLAYDETLKVPLIIHAPRRLPSGRVVETRVGLADLAPTLAALYDLPGSDEVHGRSLVPLLEGSEREDREVYFEALAGKELKGWAPLTGLVAGRFKLISVPRPELYDLEADPEETDNRIGSERQVRREMEARLQELLESAPEGAPDRALTGEDRRQLEALGYLGSGSEASRGAVLDPKQGIVIDMAIRRGRARLQQGDLEGARRELALAESEVPDAEVADFFILRHEIEDAAGNRRKALAALREVVERFPALEHLRFQLARYLYAGGDAAEAERIARDLLAANPKASQAYNLLAAAARRRGEPEVALEHFRRGLAIEPESIPLKLEIADLLVETGDFDAAVELYDDLIGRGALEDDQERLFKAAMLHSRRGELEEAERLFRRGLALGSQPIHHLGLAAVLAQSGKLEEAIAEVETALAGGLSDEQEALARGLVAQWRR